LPLALAIGLVSASAVALEITLMRLFSIAYWSHFAWMIISMAMLGYGASGALVAMAGPRVMGPAFRPLLSGAALLFGISSIGGYLVAGHSGFNPLELLWDPWQKARLVWVYLSLAVPFFMAAAVVGLSFARMRNQAHTVYLFDLMGAGVGAAAAVVGMYCLFPWSLLRFISLAGFAAAALVMIDKRLGAPRPLAAVALALAGAAWALAWPQQVLRPSISPYKGLPMALTSPTARTLMEKTSPLAWLAVVENRAAPFRHAPGLSLMDQLGPPAQLAIFQDGGAVTVITGAREGEESLAFLDNLTWAAPYHMKQNASTLILGAGGGMDTLMALRLGAAHVDAVEIDGAVVDLVRGPYDHFSGGVYTGPKTRLIIADARRFVSAAKGKYDIIQAPLADAFGASVSGAGAVSENYMYTVEALEEYLARLNDGGWVVITRWLSSPPKESLKLLAALAEALERTALAPRSSVVAINSWNTVTLLAKKGAITGEEINILRVFCEQRGFDAAYYPGINPDEAARFNTQQEPYLYMGAVALLGGGRKEFIEEYKFDISPATDNRPYYYNYFRYSSLGELWNKGARGGYALMEHGYLTLLMALAQAALLMPALAVMVIILMRKRAPGAIGLARSGIYFAALGLAFMFMEMAFIQKLALFLGHPVLSASVVISSFLVFAGAGSRFSKSMAAYLAARGINPVAVAVAIIAMGALLHVTVVPHILRAAWGYPEAARFALAALILAPVSFFMGTPFPLGMAALDKDGAGLIPWAWTANGLMSVMGAMLGMALQIHFGFDAVLALAVGVYTLAAWVYGAMR